MVKGSDKYPETKKKMLHWCFSTSHVLDDANRINMWTSKEKKKIFQIQLTSPQNYFLMGGE